ncbi:hypothetical protein NC652_040987 [Populus alba x Populus x berolinensis]|uniref:Uncharacterized protein n=2 Tax=Populus alba x Populus x berolinensis TaxID=444605 RepID=A0AAD6R4T0_9ROSI|nr:hypothetical protein NC652_040987 [Populus alba x Populus x berolinensis]KAJ7002389.1 hypothetical protein NC653_007757 [Populus alba x Populus x berolinensis]
MRMYDDQQNDELINLTFKGVVQHFNEVFSELVQGGHGYLVMMKKKMFITKMIIVTMDAMKQIWREICYCENEGCRVVLVSCDCSWLMVVREKQKVASFVLEFIVAYCIDKFLSSCGIAAFIREK